MTQPGRKSQQVIRLRRYYRITDEGTAELAAEVGRLRANAAVAA